MADFQHGLFDCFGNLGVCIITYVVPCYTFGKTAEAIGEDCLTCGVAYVFLGCYAGMVVRGKIREQKNIEGSRLMDCLTHWFCPLCAIVQDHREVVPDPAMAQSMARV